MHTKGYRAPACRLTEERFLTSIEGGGSMRHPRKYLRLVGLTTSLSIGGVLAGMLAPLPSEAMPPTVTLKVDNGTPVSILSTTNTSSACTATEVTLGYTHCYAINTALTVVGAPPTGVPQRSYNVRNAPGATARLRVGDNAGSDKFSLIGVQFIPTPLTGQTVANWGSAAANTNETHVLTIVMSNTFNSARNVNNKGTYVWALRAGGEFRAGPPGTGATICGTAACNTIGNSVTFPGTGTFSPTLTNKNILTASGANSQPLSFTVAGPTSAIVSFNGLTNTTLGQVNPTYPTFVCDQNGGDLLTNDVCTPSIKQTMTVTLKGPDSFVLVNGGDSFAANCETTLTAKQQKQIKFLTIALAFLESWESRHHNATLEAFIAKIRAFLDTVNSPSNDPPNCSGGVQSVNLDIATAAAADQVAFAADGAVPAEPALAGTITIVKHLNDSCAPNCVNHTFNFSITNQSTEAETTHSVETDSMGTGTTTVTVLDGTYNVVESPQSGWNMTASSCNGGNTNGVTVSAGDTITCDFTNSPSTGNDLGTIRLTWGEAPLDLDSHINIPNGHHVYYANQGSLTASPYADLDLDDVTGFGPENITVVRRMKGTYQYFVHNFSNTFSPGMTGSPARVELIRNGVTTVFNPPPDEGTNRYWHVFNVIVDTETCGVTIEPINQWSASPPTSIPTTENLCP